MCEKHTSNMNKILTNRSKFTKQNIATNYEKKNHGLSKKTEDNINLVCLICLFVCLFLFLLVFLHFFLFVCLFVLVCSSFSVVFLNFLLIYTCLSLYLGVFLFVCFIYVFLCEISFSFRIPMKYIVILMVYNVGL